MVIIGTHDIRGSMKAFHPSESFTNHTAMTSDATQLEEPSPFLAQNPFLDILNGTSTPPSSGASPDGGSHDDAFSDIVLTYISQMLMEEDDKVDNFHEYMALQATEKNFHDVLGENHPPPPVQLTLDSSLGSDSPDDSISPHNWNSSGPSSSSSNGGVGDGIWLHDFPDYQQLTPVDFVSQSSFVSSNGLGSILEEQEEDFLGGISDLFRESETTWQFKKGEEEARKFLPSPDKLVIDVESWLPSEPREDKRLEEVKVEKEEREHSHPSYVSRGKKNRHSDDLELAAGRSMKHTAFSFEDADVRSHMFDESLLCNGKKSPKAISDLRAAYQIGHSKDSSSGKGRGGKKKKQQSKKEVVDLRTLLIQCAQMVAADDRSSTSELLKQIRHNSSPIGDDTERLAHYFAEGLEARLAGTGSDIYHSIKQKRRTACDFLKAYQLYLAACPYKRVSYFFANQQILNIAEKATRVHVVDFCIGFGFQWPCLIQRMAMADRAGGPPRLRITGIDVPQPGFRPRERLDETGRRLSDYAQSFGIPFEYKGISSRLEDVRVEDIDIDKDEILVVNCLYMLHHLADETVVPVDCPRNKVLNTIWKMKPDIFIHGVVNGLYGAPFFVTRFREALFFFSAIFDMLETNVPREDQQRLLIEREIFGREIINVVACEGLERVERPETYKQWQVRNQRAGFVPRPLHREIFKKAKDKVRDCYDKDFIIDEDGRWLLQGWKGRILFALSSWKPNSAS